MRPARGPPLDTTAAPWLRIVAITTLVDKAQVFRALHRAGTPLVLPNAWDVVSARIVAAAGAAAIATTSAGVVWSLGYRDGDHLDRGRALDAIARVAAAVDLPVTADIESGYAADPSGVAETVRGVVAAGAAGINLQDSFRPINEQVERIAAARTAADATGVPLFINARIDTHRLPTSESGAWLRETVNRAEAYMAAGADGVFVLGVLTAQTVAALAVALCRAETRSWPLIWCFAHARLLCGIR